MLTITEIDDRHEIIPLLVELHDFKNIVNAEGFSRIGFYCYDWNQDAISFYRSLYDTAYPIMYFEKDSSSATT